MTEPIEKVIKGVDDLVERDEHIGSLFMDCVRLSNQVKANNRADVTAWGDEERDQVVNVHRREPWGKLLHEVFDEAYETGAVIVWAEALPSALHCSDDLWKLLMRMNGTWKEVPPYIEITDKIHDGLGQHEFIYFIKPVWELTE